MKIKVTPLILFIFLISCNNSVTEKENEFEKPNSSPSNGSENKINNYNAEKNTSNYRTLSYVGKGDYIPIEEFSKQTASFILSYSFIYGANRPSIEIQFGDGTEIYFNAVCEGDFFWCIRNAENEEIGNMKLEFENDGETGIISIKKNYLSKNYKEVLEMLEGKLHRK